MNTLDSLRSHSEALAPEALDASGGMLPPWYLFCRLFPEYCFPIFY